MEPSVPPVSTVPHGVVMEGVKRREAGLSQHSTTWCDGRG